MEVDIEEDERDLIDSIYLLSKYPIGGILPDFEADMQTCRQCVAIAERLRDSAISFLTKDS
jgi:hypothetical protein